MKFGRLLVKRISGKYFFPVLGILGTQCTDGIFQPHSAPRVGINAGTKMCFVAVFRQEVHGGEPPPCPRGALSRDLSVACAKIGKSHRVPPVWGCFGEFAVILR